MPNRVSYYPDRNFSRASALKCRSRVPRWHLLLSEKRLRTSPQTQFKKGAAHVPPKSSKSWVGVGACELSRVCLPGWCPYAEWGKSLEVRRTCRLGADSDEVARRYEMTSPGWRAPCWQ